MEQEILFSKKKTIYNNYIDFNELIDSIKNTRYHCSDNLNSLFQIRAINYIIEGDSNLKIFLFDLYGILYKKRNKELIEKYEIGKHLNIDNKFIIKIEKGKKYNYEDFNDNSTKLEKNNDKNELFNKKQISKTTHKKIKYKLKPKNDNLFFISEYLDKINFKVSFCISSINFYIINILFFCIFIKFF